MLEASLPGADICFFATGKSGLGHLRRAATIAGAIRRLWPDRVLRLVSNAQPDGLEPGDLRAFDSIHITERKDMAAVFSLTSRATFVLDTITIPAIEAVDARLVLVLREAPAAELHRFQLAGGRHWDQVIVANPRSHWMPDQAALPARGVLPVGWIFRPTGARGDMANSVPTVLVATGGGGTAETAREIYATVDSILERVRQRAATKFRVLQAVGPRAQGFGRLEQADMVIDPGGRLNAHFRDADIVISTAGYNSVLELATTDTPGLLIPIPRSIDDQVARARLWGPQIGAWHDATAQEASVSWLVGQIMHPARRQPIDLGESGETLAAAAIVGLG
jgi:Glycosyltransferase family 28 C-terminal domain